MGVIHGKRQPARLIPVRAGDEVLQLLEDGSTFSRPVAADGLMFHTPAGYVPITIDELAAVGYVPDRPRGRG